MVTMSVIHLAAYNVVYKNTAIRTETQRKGLICRISRFVTRANLQR